jgi:DNA-binding NarL/FixJ family response regulator
VNATPASPPAPPPIKVLLADDERLLRSGLKVLLDVEDDITVVGEATNGAEAVERARAARPDVVLMDIRMPKLDGIQATTQITRTRGLERVRILILTTYDTDANVFDALQAGASGFLLKDAGPAEFLHAIRVVAAGEALLAPRITRRLIGQFTTLRAVPQSGHRAHPCQPRDGEAGCARPRATGRHRLPDGTGQPRRLTSVARDVTTGCVQMVDRPAPAGGG